jgi:outer membrane protein TolC
MASFFKRKCCCTLGILLLVSPLSVWAQKKYNLSSLVDSANNHFPILMQKRALIGAAHATITDVRHSFLPQFKLSDQLNLGTDNSIAGSYLPLGITPSSSAGVRSDNNYQLATGNIAVLYGEYELVNFGLRNAQLNNAKAYAVLQESDLQKEQYLLELNVARLYFTILKNQSRLNADQQNIERYQNIFNVIHALAASGIKPGSDSSLAKAELSKTRISYNQTVGAINQLKQQLAYFTGIAASDLNIDTLINSSIYSMPVSGDHSIDSLSNPLLTYYMKKKETFLTNKKVISKSYLPKILLAGSTWARGSSIQYNDNYQPLTDGFGYQRFNYAVGLAITYNLFNGIYKRDKLAINRFQLQASDYELQQQTQALNSSFLQAENALQTAGANLLEIPIQLQSAEDTYNQKMAQYKAGIISLIDLTNASFVLYRSQSDFIETRNDWYLAQIDKAAAKGNLIQFIQTLK